ncbi:Protein kinase-like domain protein [Metarhizium rileyi]|uniref:Protein kinase-like domain protein n=1 Tax=Metarhizium rileyi (strain RCEF 4871) TaxID=1649241 RepID=A0A166RVB6_METRR|nr:Protein kinase-like domain protein [Metarhizium rileyi RCEF 4871]
MTTNGPSTSNVVLVLGNFVGVDNVLKLSENSRYEFLPSSGEANESWKGSQPEGQQLKPPFLCLKIGEHLFDPRGWVIGSHSDSDTCDVQLAENNQTGISRRLLRIDISPVTHNPRVTVLSDRKIRMQDGDRLLICRPDEPAEFSRPVTIDLGAVSFRAWPSTRMIAESREYKAMARQFSEDILYAMPKYMPSIKGQPETAKHNVRYGRNGAVYVNEWGIESKGMCASVMMVKDRKTGNIFGAKEPYYGPRDNHDTARKRFEASQMEYKHIVQLDHIMVEYIPLNLREALLDLDARSRLKVLTHLSSALYHMHELGITHRDVKPDNALVEMGEDEFIVKLADFGTSKHSVTGKMDTFTRTEIYMAPELFEKPRHYTNKVDIWALGLIGMELFTAWHPASDDKWDGP